MLLLFFGSTSTVTRSSPAMGAIPRFAPRVKQPLRPRVTASLDRVSPTMESATTLMEDPTALMGGPFNPSIAPRRKQPSAIIPPSPKVF
jgi:hypothetical protein